MNQAKTDQKTNKGIPETPFTQAEIGVKTMEQVNKIDQDFTPSGLLFWMLCISLGINFLMSGFIGRFINRKINVVKKNSEKQVAHNKNQAKLKIEEDKLKVASDKLVEQSKEHLQEQIKALKLEVVGVTKAVTDINKLVSVEIDGVPVLYRVGDIMTVLNEVNRSLKEVGKVLGAQGIINQGMTKTMEKLDSSAGTMADSVAQLTEFLIKNSKAQPQEGSG